jgi:hypothetical protein
MEARMGDELKQLVEESRCVTMSIAEKEIQGLSFAYGNTAFENPRITREMVKREDSDFPAQRPVANPPSEASRRHSIYEAVEIVDEPRSRAETEVRNGLRQFDHGIEIIEKALEGGSPFRWRPSLIQALHREALQGISEFAGNWRARQGFPSAGAAIKLLPQA